MSQVFYAHYLIKVLEQLYSSTVFVSLFDRWESEVQRVVLFVHTDTWHSRGLNAVTSYLGMLKPKHFQQHIPVLILHKNDT